jgi:3-oxoacyl-[acyl-carrier-protein] synthase II
VKKKIKDQAIYIKLLTHQGKVQMKRVFITGLGLLSSLGNTKNDVINSLMDNKTGTTYLNDWKKYNGLKTFLGAPCKDYKLKSIPRTVRRSMSKMSEMAYLATKDALKDACLSIKDQDGEGHHCSVPIKKTLLALGSTSGSPFALESYFEKLVKNGGPRGQLSTSFFKIMGHSVTANVSLALDYSGPQISISSACATSTQALILGAELIRSGNYDIVITGGADELHYTTAAVFDVAQAASRETEKSPLEIPGPFDKYRSGLIVSEGAGVIILESEAHAEKRNASVYGEVLGGAYIGDGIHMSQANEKSMYETMETAIKKSELKTKDIDYINAHATGTLLGDKEEGNAISSLVGEDTPISSLKGHFGHSMAACGAIEIISSILMSKNNIIIPTRNLCEVDPSIGPGNFIQEPLKRSSKAILTNNFAFGGMNTSVIISC